MYFIKVRFDRNLGDLHNRMQKLMDEVLNLARPVLSASDRGWTPEADMYETEDEIFLLVNLAGVRTEDIEVSFHENYLRIEGKRLQSTPPGMLVRYHQLEMGHGSFERIFRIPAVIDEDGIEASYADGLLTIRMRKDRKPRGVFVKVRS